MYKFLIQQKQPPEMLKSVLKNFAICTRKHLCWSLFGVFGVNFIKKRLQHRYFPMNITKFLRTPILKNIWERGVGGGWSCGTFNYRNPVCKVAKFLFTEPIKPKTTSLSKMLIECNSGTREKQVTVLIICLLRAKQLKQNMSHL